VTKKRIFILSAAGMAIVAIVGTAILAVVLTPAARSASGGGTVLPGFDRVNSAQRWDSRNDYVVPDDHLTKIMPGVFSFDNLEKELVGYTGFEAEGDLNVRSKSYTSGRPDSAKIVDDVSFQDTGKSLRLHWMETDASRAVATVTFDLPHKPEVGWWYGFEVMVKAENLSGDATGAHVRISVPINGSTYRRDSSVDFGNHTNGPEWRKLIGYGAIEDDSVKNISVYFYDETEGGIIHFDELKLWRFAMPPLWTVLLTPSYKGLIYGDDGVNDINMEALVDGGGFYDLSNMRFTCELTDTNYIAKRSAGTENVKPKMDVVFSSKGLPNGDYYLHSFLTDKTTGNMVQGSEAWDTIRKRPVNYRPDVYVDEHGRLMKKWPGEETHRPWFTRQLTGSVHGQTTELIDWIIDSGVALDAVVGGLPYHVIDRNRDKRESPTKARESGLSYFQTMNLRFSAAIDPTDFNAWGALLPYMNGYENARQEYIRPIAEAFVNTFLDDPLLGGYTIIDEPPLFKIRHELKWLNEILSAIDINRPTMGMNPYANTYGYGSTIGTCDVIHNRVSTFKIEKEHTPNRAMIGTLYPYVSAMTFEMMRNQAWQVICQGATGIKVFSYDGMKNSERLQWIVDLFAELAEYEDVIMSVEPAPEFTFNGEGEWLNITTKNYNGYSYIFAVNNTDEAQSLQADIYHETQYLTFDPLEVKLIKIPQPVATPGDEPCNECGEFPCICDNDPPGDDPCDKCGENPCVCDDGPDPHAEDDNKAVIIAASVGAVALTCAVVFSVFFVRAGRRWNV